MKLFKTETNLIILITLLLVFGVNAFAQETALQKTLKDLSQITQLNATKTVLDKSELSTLSSITLYNKNIKPVEIWLREPVSASTGKKVPVFFILAGLESGVNAMQVVPDNGEYAVVTFNYPVPKAEDGSEQVALVAEKLLDIEFQIMATYYWLTMQPNIDSKKIISMNVSFGGFVAPLALRALNEIGYKPAATIFAFGGGNYFDIMYAQVATKLNDKQRSDLRHLISVIEDKIKPNRHYRHLSGPFLVVYGTEDELIPQATSEALFNVLPEPKQLVPLKANHIHVNTKDTINQTFNAVLTWLNELGIIN